MGIESVSMMKAKEGQEIDESSLVEAARIDPAALAALYGRYVTPVYRYLYHRVGSAADAEDLTSQVFMDVLEGLFCYRDQGNFPAWLFTIARRTAIAYYRKKRPDLSLDEARDPPGVGGDLLELVEQKEKLSRVAGLIGGLDEDEQELLRLRFNAGLTHREIGELLGRSEAAVKMSMHRLLRQLQSDWEKNG